MVKVLFLGLQVKTEHNFHIVNSSTVFHIASELISFCGIVQENVLISSETCLAT